MDTNGIGFVGQWELGGKAVCDKGKRRFWDRPNERAERKRLAKGIPPDPVFGPLLSYRQLGPDL